MIKNKVVFFVLLACALVASARTVSKDEAKLAARAWVARQDTFGAVFGGQVRDVQTMTMTNDVAYHAVRMVGGGTVIMTGDTDDEPVLAFTSASDDLSALDRRNPLWALLNRDAQLKKKTTKYVARVAATAPLASKKAAQVSLRSVRVSRNAAKWESLVSEGSSLSASKALLTTPALAGSDEWLNKPWRAKSISDIRVTPLLKTQWSQSEALDGRACYNYFTPCGFEKFDDGNPNNMVCGCVATALSQVLRYFEYPQGEVTPQTKTCFWNGQGMEMTMKGGVYDWAKMDFKPGASSSLESLQEIGKLTHDAGVALKMDYNCEDSGMSGAYSFDVRGAFLDVFGYASATYFSDQNSLVRANLEPAEFDERRAQALQRSIYSNLDAGLPVVMGITGHEVVADGYGYSEDGLDYVHINMGWAGSCDYWFLLPLVSYTGGGDGVADPEGTMLFNDLTYNVFTNAGPANAVMSGRVFDDDGEPIAGQSVTVYEAGTLNVVATAFTGETGVWGLVIPAGTYDVEAKSGRLRAALDDVRVGLPATQGVAWNGGPSVPTVMPTTPEQLGNSWGNDLKLSEPTVRIGEQLYTSLDKALRAATNGNDLVEILLPTLLKKPVTVSSNCTIVATNADAVASAVMCLESAQITVAGGATLSLSNVVFDVAESVTPVFAEAGGVVSVGALCDVRRIKTSDANGLDVSGALAYPFYLDCTNKTLMAEGKTFAAASVGLAVAETCANMILHATNTRLGGEAYEDKGVAKIKWARGTSVPDSVAVGRLDIGKGPVNYRSVDDMLEDVIAADANAEIVIFKSSTFSQKLDQVLRDAEAQPHRYVIRGEGSERPTLTSAHTYGANEDDFENDLELSECVFYVPADGSLTISNLVFTGYDASTSADCSFICVDGGELTLEDGAELNGIVGSTDKASGVIDLFKGHVTMLPGSVIANCQAEGANGCGGAIYVYSAEKPADCRLDLLGGKITGCFAQASGGAVYVCAQEGYQAEVNLGGPLVIDGNDSGSSAHGRGDDITLESSRAVPTFTLAEPLTGRVGVRYGSKVDNEGNRSGDAFIMVANTLIESAREDSAAHFVNGTSSGTNLQAVATGDRLVWKTIVSDGTVPSGEATAHVWYEGATAASNYVNFATAMAHLQPGKSVIVMSKGAATVRETLTTDLVIPDGYDVTLCSGSATAVMTRGGDICVTVQEGGALTVSNILFRAGTVNYSVAKALFEVEGGSLTMAKDAVVSNITGNASRGACAVSVMPRQDEDVGGVFTMLAGARIVACTNSYNVYKLPPENYVEYYGVGGGVYVCKGSTINLRGGEITGCAATRGGGLFVSNDAYARISGEPIVTDSIGLDAWGAPRGVNNLEIMEASGLILDGEMTGDVRVTNGGVYLQGETNVFGRVSGDWLWNATVLADSAARFVNDRTDDTGIAVTNATEALLVWSAAAPNDIYTDAEGNVYGKVVATPPGPTPPPEPQYAQPVPIAFKSIVREKDFVTLVITDAVQWCNYSVFATNTLEGGFVLTNADGNLVVEPATNFQWSFPAKEIELKLDATADQLFWKATAAEGEIPPAE